MKKVMLVTTLTFTLMNSSVAFTIHHGRLLDHHISTTGHTRFKIEDTPAAHLIQKQTQNHKDGIILQNKLLDEYQTGHTGTDIALIGGLNVYVENFKSSISKTYTISSSFCLREDCVISSYNIELDAGGYFEMDVKRQITFNVDKPQLSKAILSTVINSDYLSNEFATYSEGTVKIV